MSSTTIRRRPARSIPAIICAALLLGAASSAVWAGIAALAGDTRLLGAATAASAAPWSDQAVLVAAMLTAVAGLLLILMALVPGRYDAYLINHGGAARAALRNRGLETFLTDVAQTIDGVDSARTAVSTRRAEIRVATYLLERGELKATVTRTLQQRIESLDLAHPPRVSVNVSTYRT
ncbi:DUF6286 domain-containing protein [Arthrobacter sp. Soc17.1.1.1]|uniref:DUF6286 domain-containing protein n=1 Tax=Arthrobacter sp. Soc17.1.1.1 TaxID=3121277 RepID=UPI002FE4539A